MPTNYKVKNNETLSIIAKDNGFNSIKGIIKANNETWPYLSVHPNVLMEGMTIIIPDKKAKKTEQQSGSEATYIAYKPLKQQLSLSLDNSMGEIKSVTDEVKLIINGGSVPIIDQSDYRMGPVAKKIVITTKDPLPDGVITNSSLKLKFKSVFTNETIEKEIKLEVGGLDPIMAPDYKNDGKETSDIAPKKAIQKILANLGYYIGEIDGDLNSPSSTIAIAMFQSYFMKEEDINGEYGLANEKTCYNITFKQGFQFGPVQKIKNG